MNNSLNSNDEKNPNPSGLTEPKDGVTRRRFMTLFGGSVASLAVTACGGGASDSPRSSTQLGMLTVGRPKASPPPPPPAPAPTPTPAPTPEPAPAPAPEPPPPTS